MDGTVDWIYMANLSLDLRVYSFAPSALTFAKERGEKARRVEQESRTRYWLFKRQAERLAMLSKRHQDRTCESLPSYAASA